MYDSDLRSVREDERVIDSRIPHSGGPRPTTMRRVGRAWEIVVRDAGAARITLVEHCVGLTYLGVLVANPGQDIPARDLVAGYATVDGAGIHRAGIRPYADVDARERRSIVAWSAQPVLDPAALRAYRERLADIAAGIESADARGDQDTSSRLHLERKWLLDQLSAAVGLGGRVRSISDEDERARISVTRAIRRAIDRIAAADGALGETLRATVTTGRLCRYWG